MKKILVIEDEPSVADNIIYALSTEGFAPVWCSTGREGMEAVIGGNLLLIILDVGLPDVDGFELCRDIRKISDIPLIFLTARDGEIDRVVGLEIGGDDYVVKPFSPRELTARVKAVLRRSSQERKTAGVATMKTDAPFTVDVERYTIFYHGIPLLLTHYEFRILETLLGRPGKVFTRGELMNRAWDEPEASMERTVDAHIKNIRKKLAEISPDKNPIQTHRGIGYSLLENP